MRMPQKAISGLEKDEHRPACASMENISCKNDGNSCLHRQKTRQLGTRGDNIRFAYKDNSHF